MQLTWADIVVANLLADMVSKEGGEMTDMVSKKGGEMLSSFKALDAHNKAVMGLPNIKKWVEKRPKTDH